MVKAKKIAKLDEEEELNPPIKLSSDDDEEANEDLTLKIVRKAMLRACGQKLESEEPEEVTEVKKKKVKKVRRKSKRIKTQSDSVSAMFLRVYVLFWFDVVRFVWGNLRINVDMLFCE